MVACIKDYISDHSISGSIPHNDMIVVIIGKYHKFILTYLVRCMCEDISARSHTLFIYSIVS